MKAFPAFFLVTVLLLLPVCPSVSAVDSKDVKLSDEDLTALKICEGVIQLFKQFPDSAWPGYNLVERPFIFYMPERALLFNYPHKVDGFTGYPKDWPDLGTIVQVHEGQYDNLTGQLYFALPIDTIDVAAIPYLHKSIVDLFAFIVHENFHEFQQYGNHPAFGEIPWEREELYPIQDRQNTALAYLEMRLLMDALKMMQAGDREKCGEYVKQFVAVRDYRWKQGDPFVKRYEQAEEINEGTAKYVEVKSVSLVPKLMYVSSLDGLTTPLLADFDSLTLYRYLLDDFQNRITGNAISPVDVGRYRIYPVGSAQGVLLDYLKIDWKDQTQRAGPEFTYVQLFKQSLKIKDDQLAALLEKARENYDYEKVLASTDKLIQEYTESYNKDLAAFEAQSGYRIEIDLSSKNLSRSSSSSAKRWTVERGTKSLRSHYDVYVLRTVQNSDLLLEIHDTGILEQDDWDKRIKKIVFFAPEITSLSLDGKILDLTQVTPSQFKNIELSGNNLKLNYAKPGTIAISDHTVRINLLP
ncbi:MAG TPA: hypothetical protein VF369_09145 [candidate division Zixibacteria bacterium]